MIRINNQTPKTTYTRSSFERWHYISKVGNSRNKLDELAELCKIVRATFNCSQSAPWSSYHYHHINPDWLSKFLCMKSTFKMFFSASICGSTHHPIIKLNFQGKGIDPSSWTKSFHLQDRKRHRLTHCHTLTKSTE